MNRAKLIQQTLKLANSVTPTRFPSTQVTHHFSSLTHSPQIYGNNTTILTNYHKVSFFSTKTEPFIDNILSNNDWSLNDLEKMNPKPNLTHEGIMHVLMNLKKNPQKAYDFFKWVCDKNGFEPNSVVYNLVLRTIVGRGLMEKFWGVAKEMKEKGFSISTKTYIDVHRVLLEKKMGVLKSDWSEYYVKVKEGDGSHEVVSKVVDVILSSEWSEGVESKLREIEFPLSESFLVPVLRFLNRDPLKGLRFFEWVGDSLGYEHNAVTYNEVVKVLGRSESVDEFWGVVNSMRGKGFEVATDTYSTVWKNLPIKDAVALFEFMMDGPYKLSEKDCALIVGFIAKDVNADVDLVFRVTNKFEAAGNKLTKAIYDVMHRCLCTCGRFDEAEKIIEAMANDTGCVPDNLFYRQEIHGLCKFNRFDEAWKVLDKMEAQGCIPDVKTWTQLMRGFCSADQLDQAILCFGKMKEKNVDPDANVLETMLKGFYSKNELLGAYTFLLETVKKSNVKPLQGTYKVMIEKLAEAGKLKEAMCVVNMMKKHNYPPLSYPLIQYISKSGSVEDAEEFLKMYPIVSTSCYVRLIGAFLEEGRHQEAKDLFDKSPRQIRTHNSVIRLFGSEGTGASAEADSTLPIVADQAS